MQFLRTKLKGLLLANFATERGKIAGQQWNTRVGKRLTEEASRLAGTAQQLPLARSVGELEKPFRRRLIWTFRLRLRVRIALMLPECVARKVPAFTGHQNYR